MITASICTIGDEILIGQITDTNSAMISKQLNKIGIKVVSMVTCSDDNDDILTTLERCLKTSEIVISTGGLGPTKDDITKKVLCTLSKSSRYVCNKTQMEINRRILSARGIEMMDLNLQQAYVPNRCTVIPNRCGTAPIMQFSFAKSRFNRKNLLFSMPGVPFETEQALADVISSIKAHYKLDNIVHHTVCTFGIPESQLAKRIEKWEDSLPENIHLAYLPNPILGVRLRLSIYGVQEKEGKKEIAKQIRSLKKILGNAIYGEGETTPQKVLGQMLEKRGATLSTAESCTGGYIAHLLTQNPGASRFYVGGIVSYDNKVKTELLGVKESVIKKVGAVSKECVEQMAEEARKKFRTTYSIAASGIAGPDGGRDNKPAGTFWMAVATPSDTVSKNISSKSTRQINIERFSASAVNLLRETILEEDEKKKQNKNK